MLEVEYKAPVADLEDVVKRLRALGATVGTDQIEEDVYYAHPVRDLAATDEAVRVRTIRERSDAMTPPDPETTRCILTYKGPRVPGPTRSREEIEVNVDGDIHGIMAAMSFPVAGRVRKRRRHHHLDGLTVTLDMVEGLGGFVEVEALVPDPAGRNGARHQVMEMASTLRLGDEETRSYLEMILETT